MSQYVQTADGNWATRVAIAGAEGSSGAVPVSSNEMLPVDIQSRYAQTIQTHNAVSVGASGFSLGSWIETKGYDKVVLSVKTDVQHALRIKCHWSMDGTNAAIGNDYVLNVTATEGNIEIPVKLPWLRVEIRNDDSATAHVMSAYAYLKA